MSKNSRYDHFFLYPKYENGTKTGHTICVILRNGRMYHGESLCSTKDRFVKNEGRIIAYERAMLEYERDAVCKGEQTPDWENPYIKEEINE